MHVSKLFEGLFYQLPKALVEVFTVFTSGFLSLIVVWGRLMRREGKNRSWQPDVKRLWPWKTFAVRAWKTFDNTNVPTRRGSYALGARGKLSNIEEESVCKILSVLITRRKDRENEEKDCIDLLQFPVFFSFSSLVYLSTLVSSLLHFTHISHFSYVAMVTT